jgi:hypothetical protein
LGNIHRTYDSKAKLPFGLELRAERLLPNFETTWQCALLERHNKKRHPCPKEAVNVNFTLLNFTWPRPDFRGTWQLKPVSDAE